jgi:hypothetical protein
MGVVEWFFRRWFLVYAALVGVVVAVAAVYGVRW